MSSTFEEAMREIRHVRQQMKEDFQFNALSFRELSRSITALSLEFTRSMAEMSERMNQMEGRARLQEQRFDVMLGAVEVALREGRTDPDTVDALADLRRRVEILEQQRPSAA